MGGYTPSPLLGRAIKSWMRGGGARPLLAGDHTPCWDHSHRARTSQEELFDEYVKNVWQENINKSGERLNRTREDLGEGILMCRKLLTEIKIDT
jgi:hypothetical protein